MLSKAVGLYRRLCRDYNRVEWVKIYICIYERDVCKHTYLLRTTFDKHVHLAVTLTLLQVHMGTLFSKLLLISRGGRSAPNLHNPKP